VTCGFSGNLLCRCCWFCSSCCGRSSQGRGTCKQHNHRRYQRSGQRDFLRGKCLQRDPQSHLRSHHLQVPSRPLNSKPTTSIIFIFLTFLLFLIAKLSLPTKERDDKAVTRPTVAQLTKLMRKGCCRQGHISFCDAAVVLVVGLC
jgi:hypothetical protein